jgi:hypothetical protein
MNTVVDKIAEDIVKNGRPAPNGYAPLPWVQTWLEVAVFPTEHDLSDIHRLADIPLHDGKIVSQEFPGCSGCNAAFVLPQPIVPAK